MGVKTRLRAIAAREKGYLQEDLRKARAAITPSRVSHWLIVGGAVVIVASVIQANQTIGGTLAGVFILVYGLIFVDLDATPRPRRRRRR